MSPVVEILGCDSKWTDVLGKRRRLRKLPTDRAAEIQERPNRQLHRHLRDEERAEVVARYVAGESVSALDYAFGIRRQTISANFDRRGIMLKYKLLRESDL